MPRMQDRRRPLGLRGPGRDGSLAARLRRVRERQGLSLGTVASMLNVPADQLARIEAGTLTHGAYVERVSRWLSRPDESSRRR